VPAPAQSTPQASTANPANPDEVGQVCSAPPTLRFGATCPAKCNKGYTGKRKNSEDFVCGADGQWTGSLTCPAVECSGDPDDWTSLVGRGTVPAECRDTDNQKTFSETCEVTCDEGYTGTTDGYVAYPGVTATYTCSNDARKTTGVWSGSLPTSTDKCQGASRLNCLLMACAGCLSK
jgi:hypothetical protein